MAKLGTGTPAAIVTNPTSTHGDRYATGASAVAQQRSYSAGTDAAASSIDQTGVGAGGNGQLHPFFFYRKALTELVHEQFFMPLADVRAMP